MKTLFLWLALASLTFASNTDDFIASAAKKHGDFGEKAARFLVEHMPAADREKLSADFLTQNLDLALKAREQFPWGKKIPAEIFLNDVLPYAVFDETRDPWRAEFYKKAAPLVQNASSITAAVQILNRDFFKLVDVHYNTGRKLPNQSPKESMAQGRATCTGLSIILVDACRAVGIPARAVGTPMWSNGRGNHTWVEIWDGDWHFTGADEYNEKGLDRGWFTHEAAQADASKPRHAIYATSWKKSARHFPMVWNLRNHQVGAVDVTARYVKTSKAKAPANTLGLRFYLDGKRLAVAGQLTDAEDKILQEFKTKAGRTDLNDMPRLSVEPGKKYRLQFTDKELTFQTDIFTAKQGETTRDIRMESPESSTEKPAPEKKLSKKEARKRIAETFQSLVVEQKKSRAKELKDQKIIRDGKTLKWLEKTFGSEPENGRSLWISMHGGGGAPARVNDQQWRNQIKLYQPKEGIYLAPRAPTNTWNLWHQSHIDPLFARLIGDMVALRNVNPDKVYLLGYSAGGDGVWQLAPRLADRFAAASMMAGHPGDASLLPLRNLPFAIFVGGEDSAYNRNKLAATKTAELDKLHKADPEAYTHISHIYKGMPHWMNLKDAIALPWMAKFTRNPWPKKIVWVQDDITHERFYWLQIPAGTAKKGQKITAEVRGQKIRLEGDVPEGTRLLLSDQLLDLDQEVEISVNERPVKKIQPVRYPEVIRAALENRLDPAATPSASVTAY